MTEHEAALIQAIRARSKPTVPIVPELPGEFEELVCRPLSRSPRAILFDIYGTLFTSASGDIAATTRLAHESAIARAWAAVFGTHLDADSTRRIATVFRQTIDFAHDRARANGVSQPEVEIREIWRSTLMGGSDTFSGRELSDELVEQFALLFELEANPVWPMPGATDALTCLNQKMPVGLVSNAQFYTPLLFRALLGATPEEMGIDERLVAYSYRFGSAKPDRSLFHSPLAALAEQGIDSNQVVYVGNDMLNDVATARSAGCLTVLFAGDTRSLRLRHDHSHAGTVRPDSVARSLADVTSIVLKRKELP